MPSFNKDVNLVRCRLCGQWLWSPRHPEAVCAMHEGDFTRAA